MIKVPFLSLDLAYKEISQEIDGAINSVIQSSGFIGGKFLKEFGFETSRSLEYQAIRSYHYIKDNEVLWNDK